MAQQTPAQKSTSAKKQSKAAKAAMAGTMEEQQQDPSVIPEEGRHEMIAQAAYHLAEQRGFEGDMALDDWLQAEAEVNAQFAAKH